MIEDIRDLEPIPEHGNDFIADVVAMLPTENECTKWAEEAANMYPPEQWTDGFEQGYERGMIAVIEMIKEKLQGN